MYVGLGGGDDGFEACGGEVGLEGGGEADLEAGGDDALEGGGDGLEAGGGDAGFEGGGVYVGFELDSLADLEPVVPAGFVDFDVVLLTEFGLGAFEGFILDVLAGLTVDVLAGFETDITADFGAGTVTAFELATVCAFVFVALAGLAVDVFAGFTGLEIAGNLMLATLAVLEDVTIGAVIGKLICTQGSITDFLTASCPFCIVTWAYFPFPILLPCGPKSSHSV